MSDIDLKNQMYTALKIAYRKIVQLPDDGALYAINQAMVAYWKDRDDA